jgi:energy-coupling factor transporter ATP-binding protein EcfA2
MPPDVLTRFKSLITEPHGILLVTGPTGSGKTTTLYAGLQKINNVEDKIITVEDPVEYQLPGIKQIQVNAKIGLSFGGGLRAILRHDPDIIMIGEIRDLETAEIAVQSALTGHLVFSTLHTNDAPTAVTRLVDMGLEPFLVASTVEGLMAQRLVRRIARCKYAQVVRFEVSSLPADIKSVWKGKGDCRGPATGPAGRVQAARGRRRIRDDPPPEGRQPPQKYAIDHGMKRCATLAGTSESGLTSAEKSSGLRSRQVLVELCLNLLIRPRRTTGSVTGTLRPRAPGRPSIRSAGWAFFGWRSSPGPRTSPARCAGRRSGRPPAR